MTEMIVTKIPALNGATAALVFGQGPSIPVFASGKAKWILRSSLWIISPRSTC
jgi:hypothetical protein